MLGVVQQGYAEEVVARADSLAPIPDGLDIRDAAALRVRQECGKAAAQRATEGRSRTRFRDEPEPVMGSTACPRSGLIRDPIGSRRGPSGSKAANRAGSMAELRFVVGGAAMSVEENLERMKTLDDAWN